MERIWENMKQREAELIALRREFHKYPEGGWQEFYTTGKIIEYLNQYQIPFRYGKEIANFDYMWGREEKEIEKAKKDAVSLGMNPKWIEEMEGITGVVVTIQTGKKGPTVALRFDIDGLPEEESKQNTHKPVREHFHSEHSGYMHACGHDGHMAMGLVLTRLLFENREQLTGEIRIIFQPAEEGVRGGKSFATGGVLDGVDYFLSGHLGMGNKTGEIVLGTYGFLATTKLDVEFFGVSSHAGAAPEKGKNALLCACHTVLALQTLCQDSRGASRINVGVIQAGSGRNVIADYAYMQIETRGETTEIENDLYEKALACIKGSAMMYGCEYQTTIRGSAPEAKSDEEFVKQAKKALIEAKLFEENGKDKEVEIQILHEKKPFQGSEDATYFMKETQKHGGKALYLGIGANLYAAHHNTQFDFDEKALGLGVKVYLAIIKGLCFEPKIC